MIKFTECPECGTEILEAEDCSCINPETDEPEEECDICSGTGKSNNYYCPNCDWFHEE